MNKRLLYGIWKKGRNFLSSETVTSAHIGQLASSLTLTTLFSMVPMVTGALWVLGQLPQFQSQVLLQFDELLGFIVPEQALLWKDRASGLVADIESLQAVSVLFLFGSLLFLVNQVDAALHQVFQVNARRARRRWLHYLWVMPLLMALLILGFTIVVLVQIVIGTGLLDWVPGLNLTIPPVLWALLSSVYHLSNRKTVPIKLTLWVALAVTIGLYLLKLLFVFLYQALPNWSLVFGVFSALPLFLLWCQSAWSLVLYGALLLRWVSS